MLFPINHLKWLTWLAIISLVLSACGGAADGSAGLRAWIDQPITGAVIPMSIFPLRAHARNADGGVSSIAFLVNGAVVGSVPTDASAPIAYAELNWTPRAPGLYDIQAQAFAGGAPASSETARVCVSSLVTFPMTGVEGSCDVVPPPLDPTLTPTPTSTLPLTIMVNAYPDPLRYSVCDGNVLQVDAALSGDVRDLADVQVSWTFTAPDGSAPAVPGPNGEDFVAMTSTGSGTYRWSRDMSRADADFGFASPDAFALHVDVRARNSAGETIASSHVAGLKWLPCETGTPTPSSSMPETTFKLNTNCRRGPGQIYDVVTSFLQGQQIQVDGRDDRNTWLYVLVPNSIAHCWVSLSTVDTNISLDTLPVIPTPPTPTVTPRPGGIDFDKDGYPADKDCDDKNAKIHPGAPETADDKVDSNCNGDADK